MIGGNNAKNFEFDTITQFSGYNSAFDKTKIVANFLVSGSKNVYKKRDGNISVRDGQKRRGSADTTLSAIASAFIWNTSWGGQYVLRVTNSKLQVEIDLIWHDLLTGVTDTRYVFGTWFDNNQAKDSVKMVNGNDYIQSWSGGSTTVLSSTASTLTKAGTTTWSQAGFENYTLATIGSSTSQFDITNTVGTTYRYTWDNTGTNPNISATSVPIGSFILLGAQNFTAANNGLFTVTGSGANYFEITNAAGVVESNKTIGTGFIYTKFLKVFKISGVQYYYTGGEITTTLTGVSPDVSAIPVASTVLQNVITVQSTPAIGFSNDFVKVINNQLYIGSYTSRVCYISSATDSANFIVPTPRVNGSPELLTLDGTLKGIGVRQGKAHIGFGTGSWAVISFSDLTVGTDVTQQTKVDVKPVAIGQAPYAHEFIDTVGDSIVYLAQDQQVRLFGDFTNLFTPGYPSVSQQICTELESADFTGGSLKCIGEYTYITAPNIGTVYLYQVRQEVDASGQVVAERLWHPPFIWNATRVDAIGNDVVVFSNSNPQVYYVWDTLQWFDDSPGDEELPYECIAAFPYRSNNRRQGLQEFSKVFTEGYITGGSLLNLTVNYNYQGATNIVVVPVNSVSKPAYTFSQQLASLGDASLGDESLGDQLTEDTIPKFKVINSLATTNCFEFQLIYSSDSANARWMILATGTNAELSATEQPNFIINKLRT